VHEAPEEDRPEEDRPEEDRPEEGRPEDASPERARPERDRPANDPDEHDVPAQPTPLPAASEQTVRTWPQGRSLGDDECIELSCAGCRTHWRIHDRLRGFRLRCSCNAWLQIPAPRIDPERALLAAPREPDLPVALDSSRAEVDERGMLVLPGDDHDGDVIYSEIPVDAPMAPGSMRRASNTNQKRWTNRTLLEFTLLMGALLGPQLVAWLLARNDEFALLLPFASLVSGVLVALVIAWAGPYGRVGLRPAHPGYFAEATLVAALSVAIAMLYVMGLEQLFPDAESGLEGMTSRLGLMLSVFVIAVTPAVLEEIIFRGMLQGRLMALFGRFTGFFVTAAAFAIVHGQPAVLPIHLGLGLYLGWLRERSDSLLPCMLMHFLYNGTLVWLEFQ
jgi:membrane protease YdiL (CAAX protease family)